MYITHICICLCVSVWLALQSGEQHSSGGEGGGAEAPKGERNFGTVPPLRHHDRALHGERGVREEEPV